MKPSTFAAVVTPIVAVTSVVVVTALVLCNRKGRQSSDKNGSSSQPSFVCPRNIAEEIRSQYLPRRLSSSIRMQVKSSLSWSQFKLEK